MFNKAKGAEDKKQTRRNFLLGGVAATVGGGVALKPTNANAAGATAATIASMEVLMKKVADEASALAVDIGKEQIGQWKDSFSLTTSEAAKQSSLSTTAALGIADAKKADFVLNENRKIIMGNQPPPSASCYGETIGMVLFNEYPKVRAKVTKRYTLNLNSIINQFGSGVKDSVLTNTKINREKFTNDEHLSSDFLSKDTLDKEEQEKADKMLVTAISPIALQLTPPKEGTVRTKVGWERETKRQSKAVMMHNIQSVRANMIADRIGLKDPFKKLEKNAKTSMGSDDRRDVELAGGMKRLLKEISIKNGDKIISEKEIKNLKSKSAKLSEHKDYLSRLGSEPVPYLKELINMELEASDVKLNTLDIMEKQTLLLADQLQLLVEQKLGI